MIQRDGQIFEIKYTSERFSVAMKAFSEKGIFYIPDLGIALNGADFTKVLDHRQYLNYISTVKPSEYVLFGTWYDKKNNFVRYESWKKELKDKERISLNPRIDNAEINTKIIDPEKFKKFKSDVYKKFGIKKLTDESLKK